MFDVQQGYKIRITGSQDTGITKMVQGSDGKYYQARWMFGSQFAASARKLKLVHAELEAACST